MTYITELAYRRSVLKRALMSLARELEPDIDHEELERYVSDGIADAFIDLYKEEY